jgi:hypothetical protein
MTQRDRLTFACILALFGWLGFGLQTENVHAQATTAATPYSFSVTGTLANCPAVSTGVTQYCFTTTGIVESINGAAYVAVGGSSAAPSITLNGVTKNLPASFTIAGSAPNITAQ